MKFSRLYYKKIGDFSEESFQLLTEVRIGSVIGSLIRSKTRISHHRDAGGRSDPVSVMLLCVEPRTPESMSMMLKRRAYEPRYHNIGIKITPDGWAW